jgi:hypothetical protein
MIGGPHAGLSIAEAARCIGVNVHTLRYYEQAGLVVTPVDRTAGGRPLSHMRRPRPGTPGTGPSLSYGQGVGVDQIPRPWVAM